MLQGPETSRRAVRRTNGDSGAESSEHGCARDGRGVSSNVCTTQRTIKKHDDRKHRDSCHKPATLQPLTPTSKCQRNKEQGNVVFYGGLERFKHAAKTICCCHVVSPLAVEYSDRRMRRTKQYLEQQFPRQTTVDHRLLRCGCVGDALPLSSTDLITMLPCFRSPPS